jgi:uncharacterized protein with HEPN domain
LRAGRHDREYLQDILRMIDEIKRFVSTVDYDEFLIDNRTNFAVIHALQTIGEAAKNLPESLRNRYPAVPWKQMAGMRDRLAHGYLDVDLRIVWETATEFAPALRPTIAQAIAAEQAKATDDG